MRLCRSGRRSSKASAHWLMPVTGTRQIRNPVCRNEVYALRPRKAKTWVAIPAGFESATHGVEARCRYSSFNGLAVSCCISVAFGPSTSAMLRIPRRCSGPLLLRQQAPATRRSIIRRMSWEKKSVGSAPIGARLIQSAGLPPPLNYQLLAPSS